ncbi:hypothetical protein [Halocatena marina]|uniref:Uncharacterized protein n=1 Tax=Halocatena marina TaxID=2934937 RepID=A0ABD5YUT9_9EURY|nr:hypothetical protein [Halocatena marina]
MERRKLLATLGGIGAVGLAGCLSESRSADTDQSPSSPEQTKSPTTEHSTIQRHLSIVDQDSIADSHELRVHVELLESTTTNTQPATLRVSTTNEGPRRAISVGTDGCDLFNRDRGGSKEPRGLWLYRVETMDAVDRKANKWVPAKSPEQPRVYPTYGCTPMEYEPRESVSTEYGVWDDYQVPGYLHPGTYRWEEKIQIWDNATATPGEPSSATIRWGFSLAVEKPD